MAVKSKVFPGLVFAAQCVVLFLYVRRSGTFVSPADFIRSFSWAPVSGPFQIAPFLGLWASTIAAILVFSAWMTLAVLIGLCALDRLGSFRQGTGPRLLSASGLGLGVLSLAVFALGTLHLLYPASALVLALIGTAACAFEIHRRPRVAEGFSRPAWPAKPALSPVSVMFGLCAAVFLFHGLGALLLPSSFDAMNYQLALPKLYAINHALIDAPFNHLSYLPKNISMLFTLGLLSGGPTISKLFSFAFGIMACLSIYFFGREKAGRRAARSRPEAERPADLRERRWSEAAAIGAMVFFLIPVIGNQMRNAAADLGTGFYEILGVFDLLEWARTRRRNALVLGSVFWGLALGSKYTALPGFAACAIFVAWTAWRRAPRSAADALVFLGTALALFMPDLIWNLERTGNPLTPILSSLIHSKNFFFAGHYKPLVDYASGLGIPDYFPIHNSKDVLLLPWRIFVRHNDYNHDLGGAILAGLPLIAFGLRKKLDPWLLSLASIVGLYWLFWILAPIHMGRYFVAGLGLSCLFFGWIVEQAFESAPKRRWVFFIPITLALAEQGMRMILIQNQYKKPWGYLAGRTSQADYLDAVLADSPYDAEDFANRHIPQNSRILVFDEFRTFYLDRDFIAATPWDHELWHELVRESPSERALDERLHDLGITHFLANDNYLHGRTGFSWADPWTPQERLRGAIFIKERMQRLYTSSTAVWLAKIK